jgi:hypothetical protein
MKWLLVALIAVVAGGMLYLQRHSTKTAYVNGLAVYTKLPNREFIVERDCYIFKFKKQDSSWPLLGSHEVIPALPAEVTDSHVGEDLPEVRILDILRVGDHFKLASVRRDESPTAGTTISFEVVLSDEATRKFPRLDAYWILDHAPEKEGKPPVFLTPYAVMLGRE